ncbi:hypothetical protein TcWFU_008733 [Taenia crassiceps]|uniref:Uncharacterized protein n=1 Tax=Taenia crassiceps TaxID=6207 RepID=A0ABR4Q110_9CEST
MGYAHEEEKEKKEIEVLTVSDEVKEEVEENYASSREALLAPTRLRVDWVDPILSSQLRCVLYGHNEMLIKLCNQLHEAVA